MSTKKRSLLPKLKALIQKLADMSADVATLEISDQEQASLRIRKALLDFKNIDVEDFRNEISNIRIKINHSKGRSDKRTPRSTL